jgi:4-carboxymuconolactone decarboxylase
MQAHTAIAVLLLTGAAAIAATSSSQDLVVVRKDGAPPEKGAASRFTGEVWVTSRFKGTGSSRISGAWVHFTAGSRTAWHTHPHGQTLIVISGCGWVQQEGGERELIRAGDIIWTAAGVKHWHGAAANTPMSHAAIIENADQAEVKWMEKVTAAEFGAGDCPAS